MRDKIEFDVRGWGEFELCRKATCGDAVNGVSMKRKGNMGGGVLSNDDIRRIVAFFQNHLENLEYDCTSCAYGEKT